MNHYEPSSPRVAFGITAVAMTAITIGVSVVMPAKMDSDSREPRVLAALKVTAPASTGVVAGAESHRCRRCTRVRRGPVHVVQTEPLARKLSNMGL